MASSEKKRFWWKNSVSGIIGCRANLRRRDCVLCRQKASAHILCQTLISYVCPFDKSLTSLWPFSLMCEISNDTYVRGLWGGLRREILRTFLIKLQSVGHFYNSLYFVMLIKMSQSLVTNYQNMEVAMVYWKCLPVCRPPQWLKRSLDFWSEILKLKYAS